MKIVISQLPSPVLCLTLSLLSVGAAFGQGGLIVPVTPATPTDFETRNVGNSLSGTGVVSEPVAPKKIKIVYTAVSNLRDWKNTKGVVVRGHLLAFETGEQNDPQKPLTLIHEGKVRLLVEGKERFHEMPLVGLSESDREFVIALQKARREAAAKAQSESTTQSAE